MMNKSKRNPSRTTLNHIYRQKLFRLKGRTVNRSIPLIFKPS